VEVDSFVERVDRNNVVRFFKNCFVTFKVFDSVFSKYEIIRGFLIDNFENNYLTGASGVSGFGNGHLLRIKKLRVICLVLEILLLFKYGLIV